MLTNDQFPRADNPHLTPKSADGAAIGARAVRIAPVSIRKWALVAAGAFVPNDVAPYAHVVGAPARRIGWVGKPAGRSGATVTSGYDCSGDRYREADGILEGCSAGRTLLRRLTGRSGVDPRVRQFGLCIDATAVRDYKR